MRPKSSPATKRKSDPTELALIRELRKLLRNPTNADRLRYFLSALNSTLTTALIKEAMERIEKQKAREHAHQ